MSVRLLLDENLSWRLAKALKDSFEQVAHAATLLGEAASDIAVWNHALKEGQCIVTNDDDFHSLSLVKGFPPKVILLRMGNQSTKYVADTLIKHRQDIEVFISSEEHGVLEIL